MEKSKQIQIGLLALVAILLGLNLTGVFDGAFGESSSEKTSIREQARNQVIANTPVNNSSSTSPAAATPTQAAAEVPSGPTTTIEFEETEFDFGTIDEGEKVSHLYKFKNTGNEPLIIKDAKGSCGCTVPQWPKEPVPVGGTAEMLVEFNSKGKSGAQNKRVTITANTNPAQTFISIKGQVNKKDAPAATPVQ
ncbi:MAG: DUF1573 domain-containing protein [Bacteroidota bacterium]